ncbi:hypothetical protein BDV95DRAFT_257725 [Massariosphaeria phaeospora]|uniref:Uncharacterized protein n=1 Tax=Massariosphaeria phaeospora TaxID=100035 RepID=A0A7C8HYS3_9PLEO|nr:hypothetical protein BDV95DRAFT_257725 [Massariosphaeria phaeospora]
MLSNRDACKLLAKQKPAWEKAYGELPTCPQLPEGGLVKSKPGPKSSKPAAKDFNPLGAGASWVNSDAPTAHREATKDKTSTLHKQGTDASNPVDVEDFNPTERPSQTSDEMTNLNPIHRRMLEARKKSSNQGDVCKKRKRTPPEDMLTLETEGLCIADNHSTPPGDTPLPEPEKSREGDNHSHVSIDSDSESWSTASASSD